MSRSDATRDLEIWGELSEQFARGQPHWWGETGGVNAMMYEVVGTDPKNLRVFRDFRLLMGLRGSCGAQAKGRVRRGDFSMVRIRLARFALPWLGFGGSKSGVSCSSLVCRVRGTIENVRASAPAPKRWGQPLAGVLK